MKKRTIISLLLVACLATMCFVGGTFAKYTSTVTGSSTATVAKWAFTSDGENLVLDNNERTITFDLFADTCLDVDNEGGNDDVKAGKIAPGTSGAFDLKIENKSEVNATYAVTFAVTNEADIPIVITYNEEDYTWTGDAFKNGDDVLAIAATEIAMETGTATEAFAWKWAFDGNDTLDTSLGIAAPSITVKATVALTQVN